MTKPEKSFVYFVGVTGYPIVKIGYTTNLNSRFYGLQAWSPFPLEVLATAPGTRCDEFRLHEEFLSERLRGEWFTAAARLIDLINEVKASGELPERLRGERGQRNPFVFGVRRGPYKMGRSAAAQAGAA